MSWIPTTRPRRAGDPLTPRQAAVLAFIRDSHARRGVPPTIREIASELRIASVSGAKCHIVALVEKGRVVQIGRGMARCFVPVTPEGCCPACGRPLDTTAHSNGSKS